MSRAKLPMLILGVLLVGSALPVGAASDDDLPALQAKMLSIEGSFGDETWKYNSNYINNDAFGTPQEFASHAQNESSSFFSAMGYRVSIRVGIFSGDAPISDPMGNIAIDAYIASGSGDLVPFMMRPGCPGMCGSEFILDFDVDGSFTGGPGGETLAPLTSGLQSLMVDISEEGTLPTSTPTPRGSSTLYFQYARPTTTLSLAPTTRLPDAVFRLYNDLGYGPDVLTLDRPVDLNGNVTASFRFPGAANDEVRLRGFIAERTAGTAANPPYVPGVSDDPAYQSVLATTDVAVTVAEFLNTTGMTDAAGIVAFNIEPSDATQGAALLLVTVELLETSFDPSLMPTGLGSRVGSGEFLLPLVAREQIDDPVTVSDYNLQGTGGDAPEPISVATFLEVRFFDPQGDVTGSRGGDLYAVTPGSFSALLASGSVSPDPDPTRQDTHRVGRVSVDGVKDAQVTWYRLLGYLYGTNDVFYTIAYGDRGVAYTVAATEGPVTQQGHFYIDLTSMTTNYDPTPNEAAFELPVTVRLTSDANELSTDQTQEINLPEAGSVRVDFPVSAQRKGEYIVYYSITSGDVVLPPTEGRIVFTDPPRDESFVDRIPGVELPLVLFAILSVAGLLWARRRI